MNITQCLKSGFVALFAFCSFSVAHASTDVSCLSNDPSRGLEQKVVYVNGIQAPKQGAIDAINRMIAILCAGADNRVGSPNHQADKQKNFAFGLAYNYIGFYGVEDDQWDMRQDERELFEQKTAEELYLQSLKNLRSPHNAPKTSIDSQSAANIRQYADNPIPGDIPPLINGACQPWATPTATYTPHISQGSNSESFNCEVTTASMQKSVDTINELVGYMRSEKSVIIVAHSQGNILANLAYAKTMTMSKLSDPSLNMEPHKTVRIVNIANTSQVSLNNLDMTHDSDNILFGNLTYSGLVSLPVNGLDGALHDHWYRYTDDEYGWSDRNFTLDAFTLAKSHSAVTCALPGCLHFMVETYLSTDMASVAANQSRGVMYTSSTQQFRDFFEDLVYTASSSIDGTVPGNTFPYQGSYTPPPPVADATPILSSNIVWQAYINNNDFSNGVPNLYSWGGAQYDLNAHAYVLSGTNGFGVGLPPDLRVINIQAHVLFFANDSAPNQYSLGIWSNNPGVTDGVYIDFFHGAAVCDGSGDHAWVENGDPTPWQCQGDTGIAPSVFVNKGWVTVNAIYDRTPGVCNVWVQVWTDDLTYSHGKNIHLTPSQCSNSRGAFVFSPGSPSGSAGMLFNNLSVYTSM